MLPAGCGAGDPDPPFSTGEATLGVLCPALGFLVQQGHGATGESAANSHQDDEGTGTSLL